MNKCGLIFSCLLASSSVCADIQVFDRYIENGKIYPHLSDYLSLTPHLERINAKHVIDYSDALRRHRQEWERIETPENKVQMLQHVVNAVNKILKYSEDGLGVPPNVTDYRDAGIDIVDLSTTELVNQYIIRQSFDLNTTNFAAIRAAYLHSLRDFNSIDSHSGADGLKKTIILNTETHSAEMVPPDSSSTEHVKKTDMQLASPEVSIGDVIALENSESIEAEGVANEIVPDIVELSIPDGNIGEEELNALNDTFQESLDENLSAQSGILPEMNLGSFSVSEQTVLASQQPDTVKSPTNDELITSADPEDQTGWYDTFINSLEFNFFDDLFTSPDSENLVESEYASRYALPPVEENKINCTLSAGIGMSRMNGIDHDSIPGKVGVQGEFISMDTRDLGVKADGACFYPKRFYHFDIGVGVDAISFGQIDGVYDITLPPEDKQKVVDEMWFPSMGAALSVLPRYHIRDNLILTAKLGLMYWSTEIDIGQDTYKKTGTAYLLGTDLTYKILPQWGLGLAWDFASHESRNSSLISITGKYYFDY